jgi:hypothetical protein
MVLRFQRPLDDGGGEYDWVRKDQIDWYAAASQALEAQAGAKVPSLAFQHIIVPEIYDIYPALPFGIPGLTMEFLGKNRLLLPNFLEFDGVMLERPYLPGSLAEVQGFIRQEEARTRSTFFTLRSARWERMQQQGE